MANALRCGWSGGIQRLDWLLSRYWDEAEVDLAFRGVDLLSLFQNCSVRRILNMLDHLPRNSFFQDAISQDDELVEELMRARGDDDGESGRMRMSEFSPEVEHLMNVIDRLGDVVAGLVGLGGKKPPRIAPIKRPSTAFDRVRNKIQLERHRRLVERVLPSR